MLRSILFFAVLCGAAAAAELTPARLLPAMQRALGDVLADIEIVETSHFPAPDGEIEFALKDLNPPPAPDVPTRWRGYVRQDGGQAFSIWAIVRLTAECQRVVATERLEVGQPILASQVRLETYRGFPLAKDASWTLDDIIGKAPRRSLREGAPVPPEAVAEPMVIAGGAEVVAEYISERLRITMPVIALGAGRMGERISVRNPSSKKIFEARVAGPNHVVVEAVP